MSERPKLTGLLGRIDAFIEREVAPLKAEHPEFFDHRREFARSDLERGGAPIREWEEVLVEMMRRADAAGLYRFALPAELGGSGGTNLEMAVSASTSRTSRLACTPTSSQRARASATSPWSWCCTRSVPPSSAS